MLHSCATVSDEVAQVAMRVLYSCSSSMGTAGLSWVAIRRPDAVAAESRFATGREPVSRRSGRPRTLFCAEVGRGGTAMGEGLVLQVITFRSCNTYWTSLQPSRRGAVISNSPPGTRHLNLHTYSAHQRRCRSAWRNACYNQLVLNCDNSLFDLLPRSLHCQPLKRSHHA